MNIQIVQSKQVAMCYSKFSQFSHQEVDAGPTLDVVSAKAAKQIPKTNVPSKAHY